MKNHFNCLFATLFVLMLSIAEKAMAQYAIPSKMDWWYESRFGMFIHFGSYSYLGHGEWAFSTENWTKSNYQTQVSANFNPTSFNAGTIARLAKNAGMKYLVITAKHHEGFCMWDTEVHSFTDVSGVKDYDLTGFTEFNTRDILQELKDSCDAVGIKFCLYYSILDWNHPSQEIYHGANWYTYSTMASDISRINYISDMKAQLSELITKYHPAIMWFDGDWTYNDGSPTPTSWWTKTDGIDLYDYLIDLDSTLIINERVARGFDLGDFECPENSVPSAPLSRQWETCRTMNNSWGYNEGDVNYKTPDNLIQEMVTTVSRDGNYLLNIGPKGDGTVPDQSTSVLNSFGDWMSTFSESIYGTTRSPYSTEPVWGVCTKKTSKLYAHVFAWPANGLLKIQSLTNTINKLYLMNDTTALLSYTDSNGYIRVSIPEIAPNAINSVVVINVSGVPSASTEYVKVSSIIVRGEGSLNTITSIGGTLQMSATIFPSSATDKTVTWTVSDTSIASISSEGLLTSKKIGMVTTIANANDESDIKGELKVTISNPTDMGKEVKNENHIFLFPNPVEDGTLNIKQDGGSALDVAIYNIGGQQVLSQKMNGNLFVLDVSALRPGIYSVKVTNGERVITQNIIKN